MASLREQLKLASLYDLPTMLKQMNALVTDGVDDSYERGVLLKALLRHCDRSEMHAFLGAVCVALGNRMGPSELLQESVPLLKAQELTLLQW
jgi:hypothetical protein|eukprot:COSAG01_NODE_6805_length_3497_cov_117.941922_6_plen_92_part_00